MAEYVVHRGVHCQVFEDGWNYKEWRSSATGQMEHKLWPRRIYVPLADIDDPAVWNDPSSDGPACLALPQLPREPQESLFREWRPPLRWLAVDQDRYVDEQAARSRALEKSARRAKQGCSHKIKEAGFSSLLTCTTRENITDFDVFRQHWAAMLRKLAAHVPDFAAVFAFERQERGAWHVHAAIHKLPVYLWVPQGSGRAAKRVMVRSWDYIRRLWRSIVGEGNIDVDGHRKRRGKRGGHRAHESLARLAAYVSKYLTKDHATGPAGRNRWGSTQGIKPPKPAVRQLPAMPLHEAIYLAFHLPEGHRIVQHRVSRFGRFWWLYSEPGRPDDDVTQVGFEEEAANDAGRLRAGLNG